MGTDGSEARSRGESIELDIPNRVPHVVIPFLIEEPDLTQLIVIGMSKI